MAYEAYFDGACGPRNPGGTAAFGAVILEDGLAAWQCSEVYSPPEGREHEVTSNVAEYCGLLAILNYFINRGTTAEPITIYGDSDLVIRQCFGTWRIKRKGRLYEGLAFEAKEKLRLFKAITGQWIAREQNRLADELSKRAALTVSTGGLR